MNNEDLRVQANTEDTPESNPLLFWVAYKDGEDKKKHYLSNADGGIRLFKQEGILRDYLKANMPADQLDMVHVHSVQGMIAIPEEEQVKYISNKLLKAEQLPIILPNNYTKVLPITTLAVDGPLSAKEVLEDELKRRKRRKRR